MFASLPTGYSARVNAKPPGQFLLRKSPEPPEGGYSLAKVFGLGIIGLVAQKRDDPWHEPKGRGGAVLFPVPDRGFIGAQPLGHVLLE